MGSIEGNRRDPATTATAELVPGDPATAELVPGDPATAELVTGDPDPFAELAPTDGDRR